MNVLRSAIMAFSTFSKIPMPHIEWREENMRAMMCFFPFVGVAIGALLVLWALLCGWLGFGAVLFGAGIMLIPLAVTGGIHLDGFCDVVDAQSSHAAPERKREILKDPHTGAFAAIGVAAYLVLYFALAAELPIDWRVMVLMGGAHTMSRCMSGFATKVFPLSASKGMLSLEHGTGSNTRVVAVIVIEFIACICCLAYMWLPAALAMALAGLLCLAGLYVFANSQFGGMSGDLAGFFLQVAEIVMLAVLVVLLKVVGL